MRNSYLCSSRCVVVVAFVFYLFLHSKEFHDGIQCDLFDWILNTFQIPFTCVTWFLKIDDDFTIFSLLNNIKIPWTDAFSFRTIANASQASKYTPRKIPMHRNSKWNEIENDIHKKIIICQTIINKLFAWYEKKRNSFNNANRICAWNWNART